MLITLEFSASRPSESISHALSGATVGRILEIDLIDERYGRETVLEQRAFAIASEIASHHTDRVALVAACAASTALAPVACKLIERGIEVSQIAAVDPVPVTEQHIFETLAHMATNLGKSNEVVSSAVNLTKPTPSILLDIEKMLRAWVEDFLESSGLAPLEHHLVREDLLDRYLRWHSYLLATLNLSPSAVDCKIDVFTAGEHSDPGAVFSDQISIQHHRYAHLDRAALDRHDLVKDLCDLVAGPNRLSHPADAGS